MLVRFISLLCFWFLFVCSSAAAQSLSAIDYKDSERGTRIDFTFSKALASKPKIFRIDEGTPRIVIDWTQIESSLKQTKFPLSTQSGASQIRYARRGQTGLRAVIDLRAGANTLPK